ncbi:MAG: methyltransferase family protein [Acidimicrobiales bacterium]
MTATAALVGYATFLAAAFGVRSVIHRRRTGATAWLVPPTPAARVGDGLFAVGVAAIVVAPVLDLAGWLEPLGAPDQLPVNAAGVVLLAGGAAVALVAQAQMGTAWRAGIEVAERYDLVRAGLFSIVRNPFYLGTLTASLGVALMVPSVASLAGWLAVLAGCEVDVRLVEEPHLRAVHGAAYAAYEGSVPRFVPLRRPGSHRAQEPRRVGGGGGAGRGATTLRRKSNDEDGSWVDDGGH